MIRCAARSDGSFQRRNESACGKIFRVVKIKSRVKGVVFGRGRAFNDFEKAEFEPAVHVGENVFGLFPSVLNDRVAAVLKRSQFIQPVFGDEPAAEIGAAFVGLEAAGHEQRELPALADQREIALDEKLEEIPVAGALLLKGFAEKFLVPFVVFFVFMPAGGKFLVRLSTLRQTICQTPGRPCPFC